MGRPELCPSPETHTFLDQPIPLLSFQLTAPNPLLLNLLPRAHSPFLFLFLLLASLSLFPGVNACLEVQPFDFLQKGDALARNLHSYPVTWQGNSPE